MGNSQMSFMGTSGAHEYLSQELAIIALELELLKLEFKGALNDYA